MYFCGCKHSEVIPKHGIRPQKAPIELYQLIGVKGSADDVIWIDYGQDLTDRRGENWQFFPPTS